MSLEAITAALTQSVQPHADASAASAEGAPATTGAEGEVKPEGSEVPAPKQEESVSPRLQAIVKREGLIVKRERELKAREAEISKQLEGKMSREDVIKTLQEEFEDDPVEFMSKYNFSYDKIQNRILSGDEGKGLSKLEREIANLKKQLADKDERETKTKEESEAQEYETKKTEAVGYIKDQLASKGDEYELTIAEGAEQEVYDVIQDYYAETGKLMNVFEAAKLVEKHLETEFHKRLQYKKVKGLLGSSQEIKDSSSTKSPEAEKSSTAQALKETKTITSDMLTSSSDSRSDLELTEEERVQKAIALMSRKPNP